MIFRGRYRVVRRKPLDLWVSADGVWHAPNGVAFSREWIEHFTGKSPEENARGGWRCFWQETPRRVI